MSTAVSGLAAEQIGDVAGTVWNVLSQQGPLTVAKLVKAVGEPRDAVMQALGWLAREGKIQIDEQQRRRIVSLR